MTIPHCVTSPVNRGTTVFQISTSFVETWGPDRDEEMSFYATLWHKEAKNGFFYPPPYPFLNREELAGTKYLSSEI